LQLLPLAGAQEAAQRPSAVHAWPLGQVPHEPPQPSGPHTMPVQSEQPLATHWPCGLHVCVDGHEPHEPPQPSGPQLLPEHVGVHARQAPLAQPFAQLMSLDVETHAPDWQLAANVRTVVASTHSAAAA
jgi:hypothetical protein